MIVQTPHKDFWCHSKELLFWNVLPFLVLFRETAGKAAILSMSFSQSWETHARLPVYRDEQGRHKAEEGS